VVKPVENVSGKTLKQAIRDNVKKEARIVTDEFRAYTGIGKEFDGGHGVVTHSTGEYVKGTDHTNTAESFFALLKRGIIGSFHHVSKRHLSRYCDEFSFRWDHRKTNDGNRTRIAIEKAEGKRLTYRKQCG
jgi:transposase-like protein